MTSKNAILYVPVVTYSDAFQLDSMLRPFLKDAADAVMVSYLYATNITEDNKIPLPHYVDSGGFAAIYEGNTITEEDGLGVLRLKHGPVIHPREVLDLQEKWADVAFTLDFIIPPGTLDPEVKRRYRLAHQNALWALANKQKESMRLYASVQVHDQDTMVKLIRRYDQLPFDGIALGGLVPYAKSYMLLKKMVAEALKHTSKPVHVFGIGHPSTVKMLQDLGVDSVDSSSFARTALSGEHWGGKRYRISPTVQLNLALLNLRQVTLKPLAEIEKQSMLRYLERAA